MYSDLQKHTQSLLYLVNFECNLLRFYALQTQSGISEDP